MFIGKGSGFFDVTSQVIINILVTKMYLGVIGWYFDGNPVELIQIQ
jgi:hypothetical protein